MAYVHVFLQNKGGCGKTTLAYFLAQYLLDNGFSVKCIDVDPLNHSLGSYERLNATSLSILDENGQIDPMKFGPMVDIIAGSDEDDRIIIDNGSGSFMSFCSAMSEAMIFDMLTEMGHTVYIHSPFISGNNLGFTAAAFIQMADTYFPSSTFIAWINPYFGRVSHEGKSLSESNLFKNYQNRIAAVIDLPALLKDSLSGKSINMMTDDCLTFEEAIDGQRYSLYVQQILQTAKRKIYSAITSCPLL